MKHLFAIVVVLLSVCSGHALAASGNLNFLLGGKQLTDDWNAPYDEQTELGVLFDVRGDSWPVSIAVDLLVSAEHVTDAWGNEFTASTGEFDVGLRKVFDLPGVDLHPYVGGGFGIISAAVEEEYGYVSYSDSDGSVGYWLNGGIYWTIGGHFNLGVDARYSKADVTIYGNEVGAGGTHFAVVAGYHW